MPYIYSMPRAGLGYVPGQIVSEEFAATHPGMVSPAPEPPKPVVNKQEIEKEAEHDG